MVRRGVLVVGALAAAGLIGLAVVRSARAASLTNSGFGEGYALNWYGPQTPTVASVEAAWSALLGNPNLQKWKSKMAWDTIRLGFYFKDVENTVYPSYTVDSTDADGSLSALDAAVALLSQAGFKVMPCAFNYTGSTPSSPDMAQRFLNDWINIATHFAGDTRIARYQIGNEMTDGTVLDTSYGSLADYFAAITDAIRSKEPNRSVVWPTGHFILGATPYSPSRPNIYRDWHVSTYRGNPPTGCMSDSQINNWPVAMASDLAKTGIPTMNGEINAQFAMCNDQSIAWVDQMVVKHIPYICWGYKEYAAEWDVILNSVVPP